MTVPEEQTISVIKDIRGLIDKSRRILVASHISPDGDAIGTQLACGNYLKDLGKEVVLARCDEIPDKYLFLRGVDQILPYSKVGSTFDTALILECPSVDRLGAVAGLLSENTILLNIDHHQDNSVYGSANWVDSKASSVGEMMMEFFLIAGYDIPSHVAEQLYTAIMTDTGRFRFPSTTQRTMEITGMLIAAGAGPQQIANRVYFNMPSTTIRLTGKVLNEVEYIDDGKFCVLTMTREMLKISGAHDYEAEGLVDFTLYGRGVRAGALLREIDATTTKASLRSVPGFNVATLAGEFGGGGHVNAAGCTINLPLQEARNKIMTLFRQAEDGTNK